MGATWKRNCALLLAAVMTFTPCFSSLAGTGAAGESLSGDIDTAWSELSETGGNTASASDASVSMTEETEPEDADTSSDSIELENDLVPGIGEEDDYDLASDSDAGWIDDLSEESVETVDYDLASDSDAELINDLLPEEGTITITDTVVLEELALLSADDVIDSGTCGDNLTWELDSDYVLTISGSGAMKAYNTSSTAPWYEYCNLITETVIGEGVSSVGNNAFYNCIRLSEIVLPDTVTSLGDGVFYNCYSLSDISIPDSVISIGDFAFYNCTSLDSITVPDSVTSIGESIFLGCTGLTGVTLSGSLMSVPYQTFKNCTSLDSIIIPDSVTSIAWFAFYGCTGLTRVVLPDSLLSIGEFSFTGCISLSEITIPESVTSIGQDAFDYCYCLTSITVPGSVTQIGDYAFRYCTSLSSLVLNDGVAVINSYAFYGCSSLTEVTIPDGIVTIDTYAFGSCTDLSRITFAGSAPASIASSAFDGVTATVYYPADDSSWDSKKQNYGGTLTWMTEGENTDLSNAVLTLSNDSYTYNGNAKKPVVTVVLDGETLTKGTDYTVTYADNVDVGTASVTVTGIGDYTGTAGTTFTIAKAKQTVTASAASTTLAVKGTTTITVSTAGDGAITYKSADTSIAKVNSTSGKVTAVAPGSVTITVTAAATTNYKSGTATVTIKVKPSAPTISSIANTSSGIKVSWGSVSGATKYNVYRKAADESGYSKIKSTTHTYYTDTDVTSGIKYTYRIKAAYGSIESSYSSSAVYSWLSRAAISKISNTSSAIKVTWGEVDGATKYLVYRKASGDSSYQLVKTTSKTYYSDTDVTNGVTYSYRVLAGYSSYVSATGATASYKRMTKVAVSGLSASTSGKMTVNWTANSSASYYQIQYSTSSSFSSYTTVKASSSKVSKVISGLTNGRTYYVRVRPYYKGSSANYYAAWSAVKNIAIPSVSSNSSGSGSHTSSKS